MRLVIFALLSAATVANAAPMESQPIEDVAEHVCIAAAVAFSSVAPASHGRRDLLESTAYRTAFLTKFSAEWRAKPMDELQSLLLESYHVATTRLRLMAELAQSTKLADYKPDFDDAERELGVHCMYVLGKLDGQGRLVQVLGRR